LFGEFVAIDFAKSRKKESEAPRIGHANGFSGYGARAHSMVKDLSSKDLYLVAPDWLQLATAFLSWGS
jgi:hypothetical protein